MKSATVLNRRARSMGKKLNHLTHGSLLVCGLFLAAQYSASALERGPVSFNAVADIQAHNTQMVGPPVSVAAAAEPAVLQEYIYAPSLADMPVDYAKSLESENTGLSEEMQRVRDWVAREYKVSHDTLEQVLAEAEDCAKEAGLDPLLIVAVMAIESSFNPKAQSNMGAQGLMQVIPRWHKDKIGKDAGKDALFDPLLNVRVGTQVLVEGLERFGTLQAALQYYGGARKDPQARYSKKVLAMKRQLDSVGRDG